MARCSGPIWRANPAGVWIRATRPFDALQVSQPLLGGRCTDARGDISLEHGQFGIPSINPRPDAPTQQLGEVVEKREENCRQREQHDDGPLDECRNLEGQVPIEELCPTARAASIPWEGLGELRRGAASTRRGKR